MSRRETLGDEDGPYNVFLTFLCQNCKRSLKTFALEMTLHDGKWHILKFGESPSFGDKFPSKVLTLLRDEKEYLIQGKQAENLGLGIGAFAYYRRVVEHQKNTLLREMIRVADRNKSDPTLIEELHNAIAIQQFSAAVESIKRALPDSLRIDNHSPLTLLHDALSKGLHAKSDADCLVAARDVRIVLIALVERIANALKDDRELSAAVGRLTKPDSTVDIE